MKKHLFILGNYFPNPSANGICIENICKSLIRKGDEVFIICENVDLVKHEFIKYKGVNIFSVKPRLTLRIEGILKKYKLYWSFSRYFKLIVNVLHYFTWPLTSKGVEKRFEMVATKILKENTINNIICVFTPFEALKSGINLKAITDEPKLTFYFLDAYFNGCKPSWLPERVYQSKIKNSVNDFYDVDQFIFMKSHSIPAYFEKKFSNRIMKLDIPLFRTDLFCNTKINCKKNKTITFVYVGNFVKGLREPYYFLEVFDNLRKNNFDFVLNIYGNIEGFQLENEFSDFIESGRLILNGQVSHEKALMAIQNNMVLVNIGSNNYNFIPSKIFEYISTGKPILNFSITKEDPSIDYLDKYKNSYTIINKEYNYSEFVKKIHGLLSYSVNQDELKKIFSDNRPENFIEKLF